MLKNSKRNTKAMMIYLHYQLLTKIDSDILPFQTSKRNFTLRIKKQEICHRFPKNSRFFINIS